VPARKPAGALVRRDARVGLAVLALAIAGCSSDPVRPSRPPPGPPTGEVVIHIPERLTGITTGETDALGRPVRVACVTCHSLRKPAALPTSTSELDEFHQGLAFAHGGLSCAACHVLGDQTTLHLADGAEIAMTDAILLCRQCHGSQARDYDHGAHGGMSGHWDLSVGDRVRNHCIDCHDAHAPAFQPSRPVLPPLDRGLLRSRKFQPTTGGH
jgi:formate-dependent nitrite reductase cytochrome c552 subunit